MEGSETHPIYEFDGFRLDPARRQFISANGQPITLTSRVFDTLLYFVKHHGELMNKDTLLQAIWPDTVVEEGNLTQTVSVLRRALGEHRNEHRFIITDPGRGYRFVADVNITTPEQTSEADPRSDARPWAGLITRAFVVVSFLVGGYVYFFSGGTPSPPVAAQKQAVTVIPPRSQSGQAVTVAPPQPPVKQAITVSPPPPNSIAVLPFVNMSPDKGQDYFSDGITEELINHLARIHGLLVTGRTSSFFFKGKNEDLRKIGKQLNVAHILEGSVRKIGNRVRINAQLINTDDGYHLWSQSYDRKLEDIFAIQDETATAVADALSVALGKDTQGFDTGGTRNFAAYDAYLAGRSLNNQLGREGILKATAQLEKAVKLDPDFANAWSLLADVYFNAATLFVPERGEEFFKKSVAAAARAQAVAPGSVAALQGAALQALVGHDMLTAEKSLKQAFALAPSNYLTNMYYGVFFLDVGRPREAIESSRLAVRTEPLELFPAMLLAVAYEINGDFKAALKEYERGEGLVGNQGFLRANRMWLAMAMDDRAMMRETVEKQANIVPPANARFGKLMLSNLDTPETALKELHRIYQDRANQAPNLCQGVALWASYFGDQELAVTCNKEISTRKDVFTNFLIWRAIHKPMRRLPGFKDLVRTFGYVDYWRATGNWGDFCHPVGEDDFECE